jgi:8-oxo-dGTP pyrophosphatase MutT (NUDIX family)
MRDDGNHDDNPWREGAVRTVFENPWLRLEEQDMLDPAGKPRVYGLVRFKKLAVGALPIEPDGTVHLVGQWRVPLKRYSWEMPEGGAEAGEDARDCALRELEEEAGLKAGRMIEVLRMALSNSVTDEEAVCFLATDLSPGAHAPEDTEVLRQRRAHFRDVLAEVVSGKITDSLTVATVLRVHHMAVEGELEESLARAILRR